MLYSVSFDLNNSIENFSKIPQNFWHEFKLKIFYQIILSILNRYSSISNICYKNFKNSKLYRSANLYEQLLLKIFFIVNMTLGSDCRYFPKNQVSITPSHLLKAMFLTFYNFNKLERSFILLCFCVLLKNLFPLCKNLPLSCQVFL